MPENTTKIDTSNAEGGQLDAIVICHCDMRTKLIGDGCQACNPDYWDEMLKPYCEYCDDLGEIEMDNNGPIIECPFCKGN